MSKLTFKIKTYFMITKPGIVMGNAITCAGGFALASRGRIDFPLLLITLLGLCLVVASGCVSNNYIDRHSDEKMARTKNRALVKGLISPRAAMIFAIILVLLGALVLNLFINILTAMIALFGFFVYIVFYSFSKYRSVHGTLIGSIAGAMPPVVGYCAVSNRLDVAALILFIMIATWQMPHFYAIAMYRLEDYASASIPVLPIKKGMHTTKIHMLFYILAFIPVSLMLVAFDYVGFLYLIAALLLGLAWLVLCVKGFKCDNDKLWARKMFLCSLVVVTGLCVMIPFSVV